jgi:zinc protease
MNPGHTPAEGEAAVASVLDSLRDKPPTEQEMQRAENQVLFELAQTRETSRNLAEQLGYDTVILKNPEEINTQAARFLAVTPHEVQRVMKKYFVRDNMTLLEVHPDKTGQGTNPSRGGAH